MVLRGGQGKMGILGLEDFEEFLRSPGRMLLAQGENRADHRLRGATTAHLGDPVAYRRDRRKDQLLQENGYLVLRFLAGDVARDLDMVLDNLLRVFTNRRLANAPRQSGLIKLGPG